jgi:hypothetical protein
MHTYVASSVKSRKIAELQIPLRENTVNYISLPREDKYSKIFYWFWELKLKRLRFTNKICKLVVLSEDVYKVQI